MSDIFKLFEKISADRRVQPGVEWIIAGLGNPGREYAKHRHNAGFLAVGTLAERLGVTVDRARFRGLTARASVEGRPVLLLCPQTYMNSSGISVREAADFYKVPPEKILVLVDDIYLPPGRVRVRRKGSDGGHNGLESIIYQLGSDAFPRIRIGVGNKPAAYDLADWVLSDFTDAEVPDVIRAIGTACDGIPLILDGKIDEAMQRCNS